MPKLEDYEIDIISHLLDIANDEFENHGCTELDNKFEHSIDEKIWIELDKKTHELNGDPEEHDPKYPNYAKNNDVLMWYFSKRILDLKEPSGLIDSFKQKR